MTKTPAQLDREIAEALSTKKFEFAAPKNVYGQPDLKVAAFRLKLKRVAKAIAKAEADRADSLKNQYSLGVRIAEDDIEKLLAEQTFLKEWLAANKPAKTTKTTKKQRVSITVDHDRGNSRYIILKDNDQLSIISYDQSDWRWATSEVKRMVQELREELEAEGYSVSASLPKGL